MSIANNIMQIKAELGDAELIAVSKRHDVAKIEEALAAGQRIFGENRVQEAAEKFPPLREKFTDIELHLVGPLQTNKVADALKIFDVIQTIDREKLAKKIATEINDNSLTKEFFVQVNTGEEEQKAGIPPKEAEEFVIHCINDLNLNITGLMCIPPVNEPAFMHFGLLRNIAENLNQNSKTKNLKLSMGMSADYQEAVEMGANYVRIGTGVFGART